MRPKRLNCPVNRGVEFLGVWWRFAILRDMFFVEHRRFRELLMISRDDLTPSTLCTLLRS